MWKAWVGFNASHSYGAILFGLVYGYLASMSSEVVFTRGAPNGYASSADAKRGFCQWSVRLLCTPVREWKGFA
jgi:hypothetical protein